MIQKHLSLNKNKTPNPIKERLRDRLQITLLTLRELKRLTLSSSIPFQSLKYEIYSSFHFWLFEVYSLLESGIPSLRPVVPFYSNCKYI